MRCDLAEFRLQLLYIQLIGHGDLADVRYVGSLELDKPVLYVDATGREKSGNRLENARTVLSAQRYDVWSGLNGAGVAPRSAVRTDNYRGFTGSEVRLYRMADGVGSRFPRERGSENDSEISGHHGLAYAVDIGVEVGNRRGDVPENADPVGNQNRDHVPYWRFFYAIRHGPDARTAFIQRQSQHDKVCVPVTRSMAARCPLCLAVPYGMSPHFMNSKGNGRSDSPLRSALRSVTTAWFYGAIWMYVVTGAALTRFGKLLGLTDANFGLLAAVPFAGALVQFPLSYFVERYGGHKPVFIAVGMIHRGVWLIIALIPWVLPQADWWKGLLVLTLVSSLAGNITLPIWVAWMSDLVPSGIRGRYFSRRNQIGQIVGLVVTLAVGLILDAVEPHGADMLLRAIAAMLALAALCGVTDFSFFLGVPCPRGWTANPRMTIRNLFVEPLRNANLRRLMWFQAVFAFATGYVGQYVWLFMFDEVGVSNSRANVLLVLIPILFMMLVFPVWGRLIDRFGRKPILIICALLIVHGAVPWIFVRGDHWWIGYVAILIATVAWPGLDLAIFNTLLGLSESERARGCATSCVAVNSVVVSVAGILSGLFAGAVAEALGGWRGDILGYPLTYHGVLFLLSAVVRLVAVVWLLRMEEPGAASTRATFEYIANAAYANVITFAAVPVRFVVGIGLWTYRLTPGPYLVRRVKGIMKGDGNLT